MARTPVRPVSAPSQIQAVSAPVNTYERPPQAAPSSLNQLAEGLAALDSGLGSFMAKRKVKTDEADKQRAIHDAYVGNSAGYDEGTKRGNIPPQASPAYMTWYRKTQGDVEGRKLRDQFAIKYQTWGGRNAGDPKAFQDFVGSFLKDNIAGETDPDVLAGLNPHIEALHNEAYTQFTTDRASAVKGGALSAAGASLTDHIERAEADGRATGKVDYDGLWTTMLAERGEALKRNLAADYDPFFVDAILLQAEEAGNEDVLGLLEKTLPGQEHPMSYDLKVREKRDATIARIQSGQASKATTKAAADEKADKENHNALAAGELKKIHDDPNYVIPEETIKELTRRDPEFRTKLTGWRKALISDGAPESPDAILEVYSQIDGGRGVEYVNQMRQSGVIKDPETYTKMMDRVEKLKNANKPGGTFDSPTYKDNVKRITNAAGVGEFTNIFEGTKGITDEGAAALYDYRTQLLQWEINNPDLKDNGMAREKAANEIGQGILQRITPAGAAFGSKAKYDDPDAPAKPVAPAARTDTQGALPAGAAPVQQAVTPTPGVSPAMQAKIKELAQKHGITEKEASQFLVDEGAPAPAPAVQEHTGILGSIPNPLKAFLPTNPFQSAMDLAHTLMGTGEEDAAPAVDPNPVNAIPEADRTRLQTLLKNPPMEENGMTTAGNTPVAPLLDLIGGTEGTDKGAGYNETLAYGKFTNGPANLIGMTLDEIDKLQTDMLSHPDNNMNSSAVGRYQVIRTTLRDLRREMGLDGDALFDKKMQDTIALHLLERRGLSQWQAGKLSNEQFMRGLSAEWASLPKADGSGTYKGQRTGVNAAGLRGVLGQVKGAKGVQVASLDPAAGMDQLPGDVPKAYSKIPRLDGKGEDQIAKFVGWNSDPVANEPANMAKLHPGLQDVIKRAKEIGGQTFVIGSGVRDAAMQKKAVQYGWSKTEESDHLDGSAVDLWPLDKDGAVVFDPKLQTQVVKAMKQAAKEMGVKLDIGADWKSFKDMPHFALKS